MCSAVYRIVCWGGGLLLLAPAASALPDLMFYAPSVDPHIIYRTFNEGDCELNECATPGTRRLLSFTGEVRNLGPSDLVMGNPANNPLYVWDPCHGHYHFEKFGIYRLLDSVGNVAVAARKFSFCLEDTIRWSSSARANKFYSCGNPQGISAGWADVYDPAVPCQFLDITGLPGGTYTLEMTIDPENLIAEANEGNNVTRVSVTLPSDCVAPVNDALANAQVLSGYAAEGSAPNVCATKQAGEPAHAGDAGGHSVWFRWTAPYAGPVVMTTIGSDFDTLLAVYTGTSVSALTFVASNDDIVLYVERQSRLTFNAAAGRTYQIAVDGWNGESGRVVLKINPPPNDDFTNATVVTGLTGTIGGYNIGGSKESGELAHAGNIGGHSVWYSWRAPSNTHVFFYVTTNTFDTTMAAYTGSSVTSLTTVASNDDGAGNKGSRVHFDASVGTTYRIAVDGFSGAVGYFGLNWSLAERLSIQRSGNAVQVIVRGPPGQYDLNWSSNGMQWNTASSFFLTQAEYRYTNTSAQAATCRFYRAALTP